MGQTSSSSSSSGSASASASSAAASVSASVSVRIPPFRRPVRLYSTAISLALSHLSRDVDTRHKSAVEFSSLAPAPATVQQHQLTADELQCRLLLKSSRFYSPHLNSLFSVPRVSLAVAALTAEPTRCSPLFDPQFMFLHVHLTFLHYLSLPDFLRLLSCSTAFHALLSDDRIWNKFIHRDFPAAREITKIAAENKMQTKEIETEPAVAASFSVSASAPAKSSRRSRFHEFFSRSRPMNSLHSKSSLFDEAISRHSSSEAEQMRRLFSDATRWFIPRKSIYETLKRSHFDSRLSSPTELAEYFNSNQRLVNGLTAMCRNPARGSAMESAVNKLKSTWPDVSLSCARHFSYLREFYFCWFGQKLLSGKIDRNQMKSVSGLNSFSLELDENGRIIFIAAVEENSPRSEETARALLELDWLLDLFGGSEFIRSQTRAASEQWKKIKARNEEEKAAEERNKQMQANLKHSGSLTEEKESANQQEEDERVSSLVSVRSNHIIRVGILNHVKGIRSEEKSHNFD